MSYVPATFTAGVALVLTAAGAAGGRYVESLRESLAARPNAIEEVAVREDRTDAAPEESRRMVAPVYELAAVTLVDSARRQDASPPRAVQPAASREASDATAAKLQRATEELRRLLKAQAKQARAAAAATKAASDEPDEKLVVQADAPDPLTSPAPDHADAADDRLLPDYASPPGNLLLQTRRIH